MAERESDFLGETFYPSPSQSKAGTASQKASNLILSRSRYCGISLALEGFAAFAL